MSNKENKSNTEVEKQKKGFTPTDGAIEDYCNPAPPNDSQNQGQSNTDASNQGCPVPLNPEVVNNRGKTGRSSVSNIGKAPEKS